MDETVISPRPVERFADILGRGAVDRFAAVMAGAREELAGRTLWHINSTAQGGGVAEMLQSILGYPVACGVPVRWLVIDGNDRFFEITKRMHHLLHGQPGDGGSLGEAERAAYESTLATEGARLVDLIRPGEPVVLHDPQTAGLAPMLTQAGARVIWSCHVGADDGNEHTRAAWGFLAPYLSTTLHQVFSRRAYAQAVPGLSGVAVIPPCIDAFSPKNEHLNEATTAAILDAAGVIASGRSSATARFKRRDGSTGLVTSRAELIEDVPIPAKSRIISQISRWDPLKDHAGVLVGFAQYGPSEPDVHLVLAGPSPDSVTDDPESRQTLDEVRAAWQSLPANRRRQVHIACLPMADVDENAAIVNALQRRSDVIAQKSLAEGFGLTVAEAMWKQRPTLGSRVGGIQDQIEPGVSGVLVDPGDLPAFGAAVRSLLGDTAAATALGRAAHERVCSEYLALRHLERYFALVRTAC